MFRKALFKNATQNEIIAAMRKNGFSPRLIYDKPNFVYEPHHHPETKYLVCLEGSMNVAVAGKEYNFEPGDKLVISGNTLHSAIVGEKGCVFLWSEKILRTSQA